MAETLDALHERLSPPRLAASAAHQAVAGANALLTFALDGPDVGACFGDEAIEKLADALKIALEVELEHYPDDQERQQLLGTVTAYLSGWHG